MANQWARVKLGHEIVVDELITLSQIVDNHADVIRMLKPAIEATQKNIEAIDKAIEQVIDTINRS